MYFIMVKDPCNKAISRESLEESIKELTVRFNANGDERICKAEFKKYGDFLLEQKEKLVEEINIDVSKCNAGECKAYDTMAPGTTYSLSNVTDESQRSTTGGSIAIKSLLPM